MATSTLLTRVTRPVPVGSVLTRPGVRTSTFVVAALVALNLADEVFRAREASPAPDDSRAILTAWDAQARALDDMLESVLNAARPSD